MIIYNVTVSVEESIKTDWLNWMKTEHIPEVMAAAVFTKAQINRVIVQGDSNNTFAIAYTCSSMKDLHQYQLNLLLNYNKNIVQNMAIRPLLFVPSWK